MNYTLKNDHLNVVVDTFGAEIHSIQHDDIEYLWQADAKFWGRHAPVLFPIVGKLKMGNITIMTKLIKWADTVLHVIMTLN